MRAALVGRYQFHSPRSWSNTPEAAPGLASAWQAFITGLTIHEQGHIDIATQAAKKVVADVQSIPTAADCTTLTAAVSATLTSDLNAVAQAQIDYDTATNHGVTQGAVLNG